MAMNYNTMVKLFKKIIQGLISREDQQVDDIISHNQLSSDLKIIFKQYVNLVRSNVQTNDAHIRDYVFLKDIIDRISKGFKVSIEDVMSEHEINTDKRQLVVELIKRIQQIQKGQKDKGNYEELQEQNQNLHKMINEYQREVQYEKDNLNQQIASLIRKNKEKQAEVEELKMQVQIYQNSSKQIQQKTRKINQLQRKVQRLQQQNQQKTKQIQQTNLNVQGAAEEILQVQRKLSNKEQFLKATIEQNQELHNRLNQKEESLRFALRQVQQLQTQLSQTQQSLNTSKLQLQQQNLKNFNFSKVIDQKQEIIKKKDSSLFDLKQQVEGEKQKKSKIVSRLSLSQFIFSNQDDIFLYLKKLFISNQDLLESFLRKIQAQVGVIKKVQLLYKYSLHKHIKFHDLIDKKPGILLLCLTQEDRLIGGFTTAAFSLQQQSPKTKAFLFSSYQDNIKIYNLKSDRPSLQYDDDYIIFGHEELCIQKNQLGLTSSLVDGPKSKLHYQINIDQRQTFLKVKNQNGNKLNTVALKEYQVLQVQF